MIAVADEPRTRTFGEKMKTLRVALGMTQQQLAEAVGINNVGISRLENGVVEPSWANVQKIAEALGVTLDALRDDPPASPPPVISKRK